MALDTGRVNGMVLAQLSKELSVRSNYSIHIGLYRMLVTVLLS